MLLRENLSIQLYLPLLLGMSLGLCPNGILRAQAISPEHGKETSRQTAATSSAALIHQYCIGCHNEKLKTGGVVLEHQRPDSAAEAPALWERVLRKLRNNEMPPAGMSQPSTVDRQALINYLESEL